jgi:hypothetical protein
MRVKLPVLEPAAAAAISHGGVAGGDIYGQVFRDGARLNLRCLDKPALDPEIRDSEQLLSASITLV